PALQLAGTGRERQLVELERPILDREALRLVERREAAERMRSGHHLDRALIEVAREGCRLLRRAGGDEAEMLDEHDAGVGVGGHWRRGGEALDRPAVILAVP